MCQGCVEIAGENILVYKRHVQPLERFIITVERKTTLLEPVDLNQDQCINKQAFQVDEIVDDMDDFFIETVKNPSGDDNWSKNIIIKVTLDTGTQCNVMSHDVYNTIVQNNIAQDNNSLIVASNARLVIFQLEKQDSNVNTRM
ncbi:Hypothetical predicted protein [Paramuricea clavata]|uniref:Uncharacterized protein n=1 Tax=Paramuricea clavata TaxID=317549 RepID=A0A7D9DZN0_PARCT|nr:Hypothetical predicted protein [Paramuricea clavata]